MNTYREDTSKDPFTPMAEAGAARLSDDGHGCPNPPVLPEGWRRLATGLRGTRLFRVTPPGRGGVYWEAEMTLERAVVHRRFAAEIHARAWLGLRNEPRLTANPYDREEIHGRFRAACVARA